MSCVVLITFLHSSNKSIKIDWTCVWEWESLGTSVFMTTFSINEIQVGKSDLKLCKTVYISLPDWQ